jgi:chaperone required for assembly of F1-ATPase
MVADKIEEWGDWTPLYKWYAKKIGVTLVYLEACRRFHEMKPAEKSAIAAQWLREREA